jgi:hypothetical protein
MISDGRSSDEWRAAVTVGTEMAEMAQNME